VIAKPCTNNHANYEYRVAKKAQPEMPLSLGPATLECYVVVVDLKPVRLDPALLWFLPHARGRHSA